MANRIDPKSARATRPAGWGRATRFPVALLLMLSAARPLLGYYRDTHYDLTFALALATCYDWDEARLIASADWMIDQNRSTYAGRSPLASFDKISWHAFGHSASRFDALWDGAVSERDPRLRLVRLGQFLHFQQDWESHAGYGVPFGHALATFRGKDPDSLALHPAANARMLQGTADHLCRMCERFGRLGDSEAAPARVLDLLGEIGQDGLLEDLEWQSDSSWRARINGAATRRGREVLEMNRLRIAQFIERVLKPIPEKRIPSDFSAGDPAHGLPPPLPIGYARNGALTRRGPDRGSDRGPSPFSEPSAAGRGRRGPGDLEIEILGIAQCEQTWTVRVRAFNRGGEALSPSPLEVVVLDEQTGAVRTQAEASVADLSPGGKQVLTVRLPDSELVPGPVLVGAAAGLDGPSAAGGEDWSELVSGASPARSVPAKRSYERSRDLSVVGVPWIGMDGGQLSVEVTAATPGADPERVLGGLDIELQDGSGQVFARFSRSAAVWSPSAERSGWRVAGRSFARFPLGPLCAIPLSAGDLTVRVTLRTRGGASRTRCFPLPSNLRAALSASCGDTVSGGS